MTSENRKPKTENPLFQILTFGCKVNQCDSAGMVQELTALGWRPAPPGTSPALALVNTCTVTGRADQQARQAIRRLAREHPGLALWVTGCYAQRAPQEIAALPGVCAVFGNPEKVDLARLLRQHGGANSEGAIENLRPFPSPMQEEGGGVYKNPWCCVRTYSGQETFRPWRLHSFPGHTRAWLKIQEGCNHHCTYCIVPLVRGPRRSLPPGQVAASLRDLGVLGYREVVLTGVDLGQYGQDLLPASSLAGLVATLKEQAWPFRVRLSSLEPQEVTPALLRELASWANFCPHLHLPLQSGAAAVLSAMGRPYGPQAFHDLVRDFARLVPGAAIGLDVLVGFPGETAADFEATRTLVASLPVTYLHVFPYSPRPGTPAARLQALPGPEIRRRAEVMRDLGRRKKLAFLAAQLGQVRQVLVEGPAPRQGWLKGLSDNYLRVIFPGPGELRNCLTPVRLEKSSGELLVGKAVSGKN
jgi:threonylcarbamoyladenosine tRNA methylthiotransferase MtaB